MAESQYRFHQQGTGQYYHPQHNQHNNHRNLNRATSPHGSRRPFNTDTPSPSRSPVNPASQHFTVYNNGYQAQHGMMNGGQGHPRNGMGLMRYQQNHHPHHNQVNQHHSQHHHANTLGHQHTISSGGFSNTTPHLGHFGQDHGPNGHQEGIGHEDFEELESEYWTEQEKLAVDSREFAAPHSRSKWEGQQSVRGPGLVSLGASGDQDNTVLQRIPGVNGAKTRRVPWEQIDFGGQGIRAIASALFQYDFLKKLYLNNNHLDKVPPSIGRLKLLEHLDLSHNQLTELPEEIGMLTNLKNLHLISNQINNFPDQLGYLYKLETLAIFGNPLREDLREKMGEEGTKGLIKYLRENMEEPQPPLDRPWEIVEDVYKPSPDVEKFSALTYNILCERYATTNQYGYAAERLLQWDYRKDLILNEVVDRNADIVCLQELDKNSYDNFFRGSLANSGYKGYYAQKGRAETLGDQAIYVDGCGTFWKDKKYILLDSQHLVLGRKAVERPGAKASADMLNRVWQRDDIATITLLENRNTGSRIIVANTHIYWDPAYKDVQLIQAAVLMEELSKITERYSKVPACKNKAPSWMDADNGHEEHASAPGPSLEYANGVQIPLIICGDFNSGTDSAVYDLLAHGGMASNHSDFNGRNYGSFTDHGMHHPFSLKSAYGSIGELPWTNYTAKFIDVLDYIWFSSNSLRVTALLGRVDEEYLQKVPGFPNFHYPSDHLLLMAEFLVDKRKPGREKVDVDFGPSSRK